MKIKDGFILREMDVESAVVVPVGETSEQFNGMITLNETGMLLWRALEQSATEETLRDALCEAYEVAPEAAARDVTAFLQKAREAGLLEE